MTTEDFIIELFDRIDEAIGDVPKHRPANLYPNLTRLLCNLPQPIQATGNTSIRAYSCSVLMVDLVALNRTWPAVSNTQVPHFLARVAESGRTHQELSRPAGSRRLGP